MGRPRAAARALRAAVERWGERRPAMRIDFDQYVAEVPRELAAGAARLRRGARPFTPDRRAFVPAQKDRRSAV
ncbi:hypothetical protein ACFW9D_20320 [Streptomyces sp. NPDC059524]|uniref:hypothetical protein n=1 Tax=Streptomyces sp. NPDC059524 TaxID=3346856 RepID=UPI0036C6B044